MKYFIILIFTISSIFSQNLENQIKISFRVNEQNSGFMFVPGQFNGWGPNSNGQIYPGALSQMEYNQNLKAYIKTYTFAIKDQADNRRTMGDSVFMYKYNRGGGSSDWFSDPLNSEANASDFNNSVLRLTRLMFFEKYIEIVENKISRLSFGIHHALSDTIKNLTLSYGATKFDTLKTILVNNFYDENIQVLNYIFDTPIPRNYFIKVIAKNNLGNEIIYETGGYEISTKPLPSFVKNGTTLPINGVTEKTSFRLQVYGKNLVSLKINKVGQDLLATQSIPMFKTPDEKNWWIEMQLDNSEYEYVYELDGSVIITDPFGREMGKVGTKFSNGVAGLTKDNYVWKSLNYKKPTLDKLIIYELSAIEYAGGHFNKPQNQITFDDLKNLIPHFDSLGVNAIEFMPITDWGGVGKSNFSWGYDNNHFFSIDPTLGTPEDFKEFVDEAHSKNIAVILDVVFNHLTDASPLWKMQPDAVANPYFKNNSDLRPNEDQLFFFRDLDHWTDETQTITLEALKMWIDEYKVDGFRYDFTQGIGWDINQKTKGILGWTNAIDSIYTGKIYQIVEHLPESPALIYYSGATSGWHDSYRDKIFDEARYKNVSLSDFENLILDLGAFGSNDYPQSPAKYSERREPVNGNVNHDEQSLIYEMTQFQNVSLSDAILRDKLYATFTFTSLGVPLLWEGMEFASSRGWKSDSEKLSYRPVDWTNYYTQTGKDHFNYYKSLAMQRRMNPALNRGNLKKLYRFENEKVLVWGFEDFMSDAKVMCVANLSSSEQTITNVPWLNSQKWFDVFNQSIFNTTGTTVASFTIPKFSARVFSNKNNDELGILVNVNEKKSLPNKFEVKQNYPNPFNNSTVIKYELPNNCNVKFIIYDLMGRNLFYKDLGMKSSGENWFNFENNSLQTGVYFYKIVAENYEVTKKLIILK